MRSFILRLFPVGLLRPMWEKKGLAVALAHQFKINLAYHTVKLLITNLPFDSSENQFCSSGNVAPAATWCSTFTKGSDTVHILKAVGKCICRKKVRGLISLIKRALIKFIIKTFVTAR